MQKYIDKQTDWYKDTLVHREIDIHAKVFIINRIYRLIHILIHTKIYWYIQRYIDTKIYWYKDRLIQRYVGHNKIDRFCSWQIDIS